MATSRKPSGSAKKTPPKKGGVSRPPASSAKKPAAKKPTTKKLAVASTAAHVRARNVDAVYSNKEVFKASDFRHSRVVSEGVDISAVIEITSDRLKVPQAFMKQIAGEFANMMAERFANGGPAPTYGISTKWKALAPTTRGALGQNRKPLVYEGFLRKAATNPLVVIENNKMVISIDPRQHGAKKGYSRGMNYATLHQMGLGRPEREIIPNITPATVFGRLMRQLAVNYFMPTEYKAIRSSKGLQESIAGPAKSAEVKKEIKRVAERNQKRAEKAVERQAKAKAWQKRRADAQKAAAKKLREKEKAAATRVKEKERKEKQKAVDAAKKEKQSARATKSAINRGDTATRETFDEYGRVQIAKRQKADALHRSEIHRAMDEQDALMSALERKGGNRARDNFGGYMATKQGNSAIVHINKVNHISKHADAYFIAARRDKKPLDYVPVSGGAKGGVSVGDYINYVRGAKDYMRSERGVRGGLRDY